MKPVQVMYRLYEQKDWRACRLMWSHNAGIADEPQPFGWPTIVAERNGKIIGFISTYPSDKAIVAGPLIVAKNASPIIIMRLVEAYENILRLAKVTLYLFSIKKEHGQFAKILEKLGLQPYAEDDKELWFKKAI